MSKYYYLVTGLPELTLEDNKLRYSVADFKKEFYPELSSGDKKLVDLFYLRFDNENVLSLLKDREAQIDERGNYSADSIRAIIGQIQEEGKILTPNVLPSYLNQFITSYMLDPTFTEGKVMVVDRLAAMYYAYAMKCGNDFLSSWFEFNLHVNNILVALTARKFKMEVEPLIVGDTEVCQTLRSSNARDFGLSSEVDYLEQVVKISEIADLVEREKKIDQLRWKWMEDKTFFEYFSLERLYVFLLQTDIIERWLTLDKEKGNQMFRSIIAALKDEVKVPMEY
ncbi:MAG: DUF2764 domain-containing protein [Bacteroidaceae bacterium]|nr:DUF2764 domain-containing protein [Bacteroidaceae bacterium]